MSEILWLMMVAGGPTLLALAIAYALIRQRRLRSSEQERRAKGVDDLYDRR